MALSRTVAASSCAVSRLTSQLIHPNIVPVYDLGLDVDGHPSYAMKWVEGRSLADAIVADLAA